MGQVHNITITKTPAETLLNSAGQTVAEAVNKRKLVTVRQVSDVRPIEGADAIVVATIEGWDVVTKKGDFMPGDQCLYFEIDSFLPDGNPAWQFLVDKQPKIFEGVKGHKLRTIKLRGQVSQGLALPLSALPGEGATSIAGIIMNLEAEAMNAGQVFTLRDVDFAPFLGIKKYEAPLPAQLQGQAEGLFPSFIQKTDQERCQNLGGKIFGYTSTKVELSVTPEQLDEAALKSGRVVVEDGKVFAVHTAMASPDDEYEITMKLDGSSMTAFVQLTGETDGASDAPAVKVGVASRNLELKISEENSGNTYVRVLQDTKLDVALGIYGQRTGRSIAVQGEVMGPAIQGNRENFKKPTFFVFDIFDIDKHEYVGAEERLEILAELQQIATDVQHVPVLHARVKLGDLGLTDVKSLLAFAEGPSIVHPVREGLVFKRLDGQFSFKAISNIFLAKEKD